MKSWVTVQIWTSKIENIMHRELKFPPRPSIIKQIQLEEDRYLMEHFAKVRLEKTSGSREIPK